MRIEPTLHTPLLHPRLVRKHIDGLSLPEDVEHRRKVLRGWLAALRDGRLLEAKEVSLQGDFRVQIFGEVLGYRNKTTAGADGAYEVEGEKTLSKSGKSADAALGFFGLQAARVLAPVEFKGAAQSLDHAKGRTQTPVQQAWEYASRAPESRWIVLSNYRETRLYAKARGWDAYERFDLEDLDTDDGFARFYALLGRPFLLPASADTRSPLDAMLEASSVEQEEITKKLYALYRDQRRALFGALCRAHSNIPPKELLPAAQTILDRVLFCAFAEDRGLIKPETIKRALDYRNPYDPEWSKWRSLCQVFRGIDKGNELLGLPPLNGGLFRQDPAVDELRVPDEICDGFSKIAEYDFAEDVSVEVLGHVFEQSVTELEELRAGAAATAEEVKHTQKKPSKRRQEGVFYTPGFVTRYIVDLTIGETLREREAAAFASVYGTDGKTRASRERDLTAWERYRESLRALRILDPACGSGAFLIAAFEALAREYDRVNRALAQLRGGQVEVFDLTTSVLNENLFGVDLNGESVEITKLSLWLKTARRDKPLTYLDRNVRRGNSVVDDPLVDPFAFDWAKGRTAQAFLEPEPPEASLVDRAALIDARWRDGFDVVLGNPPYVRHELLTRYKEHWKARFGSYDGVADLYVYFFERGLSVLKPGGRLGFIVSNKWLRAGYAEGLRGMLASQTEIETLVDFGHAPIFPDADAFPCVIAVRRPSDASPRASDHTVAVTQFPREQLKKTEVPAYVAEHTERLPQAKLSKAAWVLESDGIEALFEKLRRACAPLSEFSKLKPQCGVKTGCDGAFLVDELTKDRLCSEDARSSELLKPYLRGQDIVRWSPAWAGLWMIYAPWDTPIHSYLAIERHLTRHREALLARPEVRDGRHPWWALSRPRPEYSHLFPRAKLVWKDISYHSSFAWDTVGVFANDLCFIHGDADLWLLACLNSPLIWAYLWRNSLHGKDEALRLKNMYMERVPIARPSADDRERAEEMVRRLAARTLEVQAQTAGVLDVLRMQYGIDTPGNKLSDPVDLSSDDFVREVLKRRPKAQSALSVTGQRELRSLFDTEVGAMRARRETMRADERALSKLVNAAYGLDAADEKLLWDTAPPRMPDAR